MKFIQLETYPVDCACSSKNKIIMLVNLNDIVLIDTSPYPWAGGNYYCIYLKDNYKIYVLEESYQTLVKELDIC